ncbi:MAG: outer membrane beta-barrel protein [Acidobacteriota bacterium]
MPSVLRPRLFILAVLLACLPVAPCLAQGFGIGVRASFLKTDQSDATRDRFLGGQLRAWMSKVVGVELAIDRRTQHNEAMTERVRDSPLQASLLLALAHASFSPYLLGGVGWYTHTVDTMAGDEVTATTSGHRTGTHAGFGAELRAGRHLALHGDYRYTFLHFGDNPEPPATTNVLGSRFLPSYEGSMWTAGLTVYF